MRSCVDSFNRTAAKAAPLEALGAVLVNSPEEVAAQSDVVFSIVGFPADVRAVYLGDGSDQHRGVLAHLRPGSVVVDMTTSEPSLAADIAQAAAAKGLAAFDAPVSGGDVGARNATLSIMVGGSDDAAFNAVLPLLQCMGKSITRCGAAGTGQHTKMVNQVLIASGMVGVCEGLLYAHRAGLDLSTTIQAVSPGAAGSWSISNLGQTTAAQRSSSAAERGSGVHREEKVVLRTPLRPYSFAAACAVWLCVVAAWWSAGPRIVARDFRPGPCFHLSLPPPGSLLSGRSSSLTLPLLPRCAAVVLGFFVEHFVKDLGIVLAESRRMQLSLPGLSLAYSLYLALMAQGGSRKGTQGLFLALEHLNGIDGKATQQQSQR